jgi:hypothetical protein
MIITSMNLLEFSEKTNREMGVLIRKDEAGDQQIYKEAINEVQSIIDFAKEEIISLVDDQSIKKQRPKDSRRVSTVKDNRAQSGDSLINYFKAILTKDVTTFFQKNGHCIRCNKQILYDPNRPYCLECYDSWSEWENPSYKENFCHLCGKSDKSSLLYPLCRPCFQKSQRH